MITVVTVIREMGIKPYPELTWSVGALMRDWWLDTTGRLPPKRLRPKTYQRGVHCFAIYPDAMRPVIRQIVRQHFGGQQMDLFGGQPNLFP